MTFLRPLKPEDYPALVKLLGGGPRSRYKIRNLDHLTDPPDFNVEKWATFFEKMPIASYGVGAFEGDNLVGVAMGMSVENFWDYQTLGKVIVWYVNPDKRGIIAVRLLKRLMDWFAWRQVDYIVASADFNSEASKAYRHWGFQPLEETLYLKR